MLGKCLLTVLFLCVFFNVSFAQQAVKTPAKTVIIPQQFKTLGDSTNFFDGIAGIIIRENDNLLIDMINHPDFEARFTEILEKNFKKQYGESYRTISVKKTVAAGVPAIEHRFMATVQEKPTFFVQKMLGYNNVTVIITLIVPPDKIRAYMPIFESIVNSCR